MLTTYADTQKEIKLSVNGPSIPIYKAMGEQIRAGAMPLSLDTGSREALPNDSPERIAILEWVDEGGPPRPAGMTCP